MGLSVRELANIIDAHVDGLRQARADNSAVGIRYNERKLQSIARQLGRNAHEYSEQDIEWLNNWLKAKAES